MKLIQSGPRNATIMVIGESPGANELEQGKPFVGAAGHEFDRQLAQAYWSRSGMFITNVCHERPPGDEIEHFFAKKAAAKREKLSEIAGRFPRQPVLDGLSQLQKDIDTIEPKLIIALGNTTLWALTGQTGLMKWRGSVMPATGGPVDGHGIKLICLFHPSFIMQYGRNMRFLSIADLRRAKLESAYPEIRRPQWHFVVPTTPKMIEEWIVDNVQEDRLLISDVENIVGSGDLICLGFASSRCDAICIPFISRTGSEPHYWRDRDDEYKATLLCRDLLKKQPIAFHNGLHDCQIIARQWGVMPNFKHDSMVMQHVAYPGMLGGKIDPITGEVDKKGSSLSLSFCASLYCDYYRFWKEDGRSWTPADDETVYWNYNCEDTVRTFEIVEKLEVILRRDKLWDQYLFEMSLFDPVFGMMFDGIAFDDNLRHEYRSQVEGEIKRMQKWIDTAVGHTLDVRSSKQMMSLFYDDFQCERVLHRKTKRPTLDDKALERIAKKHSDLSPLVNRIQALRTLEVFRDNFLKVQLRSDNRLCGAFNVAFVETMRFSSNVDAFGGGFNLQNLPRNIDE